MKFSKFNLIIKEGDKRILFNTLSGECFKISIDVAEMIENNLLDQLNKELYEYSCAVTPQVRQTGNRLSGLAGTAYASLFT